jgi:hypothetical protein
MARASAWDTGPAGYVPPRPTMPTFNLDDIDVEREAREAQARVIAIAAWRRFVSCVRSLPAEQAMPMWQAALAEVTAHIRFRLVL